MNDKKGKQMSETFCLGALLAVIGADAGRRAPGCLFLQLPWAGVCQCADRQSGSSGDESGRWTISESTILSHPDSGFHRRRPYSRSHMPLLPKRPPAPLETNHHSVGNHYTGFGCFSSCRKLGYGSQCFGCTGLFYPGARLPKNQWQSSCYHHVYRKSA